MMECELSVIIPVYNAEKTIRRCVESLVLGQLRNMQIILVDDCSKDHSWDVCQELAHEFSNVICVRNDWNCGVSYSRNRALSMAVGDYIMFVDSDDWVSQNYASALRNCAKRAGDDTLVLCAYHYIDYAHNSRSVVCANGQGLGILLIPIDETFVLVEQTLLQQLWNKIFRRAVIEAYNIRFDESMSMGEDFQFVLEYMEAISCKMCAVLNEPLYYYIRWNNSSLMGNFGFVENQDEYGRIWKLAKLAGPEAAERAERMIAQSRRNYVYHIARNSVRSKDEKLAAIERIMGDGKAAEHYSRERRMYAKERFTAMVGHAKTLYPRLKARLERKCLSKRIARATSEVRAEDVTIISQNCIGGVFYHDMGWQFLSPTVNLFMKAHDFVRFASNLRYYISCDLDVRWGETFPVGRLNDIDIYFMHYETCKEAREAWDRRAQRINWERVVILSTDRDGFDGDAYESWSEIPLPKVLFTAQPRFATGSDSIFYPEYQKDGFVLDLIVGRKFYKGKKLISVINGVGCASNKTVER